MWLIPLRDLQWRRRRFAIAVVATGLVFALTSPWTSSRNRSLSICSSSLSRTACTEAERFVRFLVMTPTAEDWRGWELRVTDELGCEIFAIPFAAVVGKLH